MYLNMFDMYHIVRYA